LSFGSQGRVRWCHPQDLLLLMRVEAHGRVVVVVVVVVVVAAAVVVQRNKKKCSLRSETCIHR
jgi:hypothetical protein